MTKSKITRADEDPRWPAIVARDPAFDGQFYYSVKTTGVYCHPSCAARHARPENMAFHATPQDAERAGFRPCKRCKPDQGTPRERQTSVIASACRTIETADDPPSLGELAKAAGVSPYHFHRLFKAVTGLTPKAYVNAERAKRVRRVLSEARGTITDAIYETGFGSSGRFYETTKDMLGMRPRDFKNGGANTQIHFAIGQSTLGAILVARSEVGVCAILLGDDPAALARDMRDRFPHAEIIGGDENFEALVATVVAFVEDPVRGLDLPLDVRGTAFQKRVWEALRRIPVGKTLSYAEIAESLGMPGAVRAVAGACAANSLAVAVPCHRVVRSDGALSGYKWGVERKRELLRRESRP